MRVLKKITVLHCTTIDNFTKSQQTTAPQTEQDTSKSTQAGQNICYHQENSSDISNL